MAYVLGNGAVCLIDKEHIPKVKWKVDSRSIYCAHYSMFENYIWHLILVKRFGWPRVPLKQWRCTAAIAATHALPRSLDKAGKALDLPVKKDMEGKRVMLKMCKPRKPTKYNKEKWHEKDEDFEKLYDYCINDVEVERGIHNVLPELTPKEQDIWLLDQKINTRGIHVDMELVDSAIYLVEKYSEECNAELELITNGYVDKASQIARFKNWMKKLGVHADSLDKESLKVVLKENKNPQILKALRLRQQLGKTSVKKFQAFKNATCSDHRIRDMFVYHGASTGRWTGKIVQLHNLPRGNVKDVDLCIKTIKDKNLDKLKFLYPDVMDAFSGCVRGALVSAPGKDLLVVDFAAIEARVLAWVAGEEKALEEFRTGEDSYVKMAEKIFQSQTISKDQRFVGKTAVLGCGYGCGHKVFKAACAGMGQEVSESLARAAVNAFRQKNKNIISFWYDMENAAKKAVREKSVTVKRGIKWSLVGDFLYCALPSGRKLAYHHPEIHREERFDQMADVLTFMGVSIGNNYTRQDTWGGSLVENIVQAISRDILCEAMLRVERYGYKVVLHVHDEIVVEIPEDSRKDSLEHFTNLITQIPEWADGCPIKAEGWRGKRYRK